MSGPSESDAFELPAQVQDWRTWSELPPAICKLLEQPAKPPPAPPARTTKQGEREKRAAAYLAKIPGAVAGSGGHQQTWAAALSVCVGFDLDEDTALRLLLAEYNPRCEPPWSEKELRHKVRDAVSKATQPRGYLLADRPTGWVKLAPANGEPDPAVPSSEWIAQLQRNAQGAFSKTINNVVLVLTHDAAWAGVLAYDLFAERIVMRRPPPFHRPSHELSGWTDIDDIRTQCWLESSTYAYRGGTELVAKAVETVARRAAFHPVREYLGRLVWDGTERLDSWLINAFGCEDSRYVRAVGSKTLIGGVARVMVPGSKVDTMLVLEGDQGLGKSRAARMLAVDDDWFTDSISKVDSKDARIELAGRWIVEMAELDTLNRSEVSSIKQFLTASDDKFRPAYAKRTISQPRQCIFIGTVNPGANGYLRDETGNRRFWPVLLHRADLEWLASARDQLWAEAVHRFKAGEKWHLPVEIEAEAKEEQQDRNFHDEWQDKIEDWLTGKTQTTTTELLMKVFDMPVSKHDRGIQIRVGRCLKLAGWIRKKVGPPTARRWVYAPRTLL